VWAHVEDPAPFPESTAAAEIHKAGRRGTETVKYLFYNIAIGGVSFILGKFNFYAALDHRVSIPIGPSVSKVRLSRAAAEPAAAWVA
jgi:hypothetical protein